MPLYIISSLIWLTGLIYGTIILLPFTCNATSIDKCLYQAGVLRGVVLDKETKLPIGYATIFLGKSKTSTQTGSKGEFMLQDAAQYRQDDIRITSMGYVPKVVNVDELLKEQGNLAPVKIYLEPKYEGLSEVEVYVKSKRWKAKKVGFNIDRGTDFHHHYSPMDTLIEASGPEIGNRFKIKKKPAYLQSVSFGLAGSGNVKALIGLNIYSLKNDLPHKIMLPERVILNVPPHHTGWITVDMEKYNITLKEDFAVTIEWLSETNQLNRSSLMAFASHPKEQVTYYQNEGQGSWKILKPTLTNINSIGLYVTVWY